MPKLRMSLNAVLGVTISVMGILGLLLAGITGEVYREHAFNSYRSILVRSIHSKTDDLLAAGAMHARDLGLALQNSEGLAPLIRAGNVAEITSRLNSQFRQYFVTAGVLKLDKIRVYDPELKFVAESSQGMPLPALTHICPGFLEEARKRAGPDRLKTLTRQCAADGEPYSVALVPAGGIRIVGYIEVVTDPLRSLDRLGIELGMPTSIATASGRQAVHSADWKPNGQDGNALKIVYTQHDFIGRPAMVITALADVKSFAGSLDKTLHRITLVATLVTLAAVATVLFLFKRLALQPLQRLTDQLRLLRRDRTQLGRHISVGGSSEIRQLANDFNEMTTELSNLYGRLESVAYIDPLTKLANRARFSDILSANVLDALRSKESFALMILDVDRFKSVNDLFGIETGDSLLVQIGARLENTIRKSDVMGRLEKTALMEANDSRSAARLGGDEFGAILRGVHSADEAGSVGRKVLQAMAVPFVVAGKTIPVSVSIGFALCPGHGTDANTLLRRADVALTEAKMGQTGLQLFSDGRDQSRISQLTLETELRNALESRQFILHYQPQVACKDGRVLRAEALIRWQHPVKGVIAPVNFIPIAEQSGLIHQITLWVVGEAVRACARWRRSGLSLGVAVNLSARSIGVSDLPISIENSLVNSGLPPDRLTLELTESAVMSDPNRAIDVMTRLKALGISLSIDDFGTGYSSMAYLKQLPVDELKIDRSFVLDMVNQPNDRIIVRAVIDLAHNMGLSAVAEGVETRDAWNLLRSWKCDLAQGYLLARPLPETAFLEWLERFRTESTSLV